MASPAVLSAASRLAACACAAAPTTALRASMKRPLSAAAASAAAVADSASATAAAAVAAGFPTNVTLAAPSRSGPLDLPPGAPVWKRKPGAPDQLLYERTPREMLKNLLYLAQSPHGPMRPEALHRLLQRVGSPADFELAVKGLNVARNSRVTFTEQTATLFAAAAVRCGQSRVALEMFAKHKASGPPLPPRRQMKGVAMAPTRPSRRRTLPPTAAHPGSHHALSAHLTFSCCRPRA
jgi:hypothetical protein